jgi:hypothetical protein
MAFDENSGTPEERENAKKAFELLVYAWITKTEFGNSNRILDLPGQTPQASGGIEMV